MEHLDMLTARKAIIDWRERWVDRIDQHLNGRIGAVRRELEACIGQMNVSNVVLTDRFIEKTLNPILMRWISEQRLLLTRQAQTDLVGICEQTIPVNEMQSNLAGSPVKRKLLDISGATMSTGAAVAAVPIAIGASTTTASVGGVLGLLGVTTTVVSAPAVIIGVGVVAATGFFARARLKKIKSNAQLDLREHLVVQSRQKVLFNPDGTSLNQVLQGLIEDTAGRMLKELPHAA